MKNVGERAKAQVQVKRFLVAMKLDCQVRSGCFAILHTHRAHMGLLMAEKLPSVSLPEVVSL